MAKISPFEHPDLNAQSSRNIFDVSYKTVFHAPFGMLLPCGFWRVNPKDKFEISNENQLVTPQMVRPSFMRLKEHIDYFFVPMSQIFTPSDNILTGQDYYFSALQQDRVNSPQETLTPKIPNAFPTFDGSFLKKVAEYQDQHEDIHGNNQWLNTLRLLDLLRYGNYYGCNAEDPGLTDEEVRFNILPSMNFFALACYQKAYYDYYRNPMYEMNCAHAYNIDDLEQAYVYSGLDFNDASALKKERFAKLFEVHYRWMKKDYFTSVRSNNLPNSAMIGFNNLGSFNITDNNIEFGIPGANPTFFTGNRNGSTSIGVPGNNVGNSVTPSAGGASTSPSNYFNSVAGIRFAFAYDKLLRRMREAGANFDKQMLAQFGITPIDQRHGRCFRIGGFVNRISPNSVSDTSSAGLGAIGGQIDSYSTNNQPIHFEAREFGFIIALYSTSIDSDYNTNNTVSRDNVANQRFDFFNPVFENLGLQPIFQFEYDRNFENQNPSASLLRKVIGLAPRYMEYKTHIDEVHGLFGKCVLPPPYDDVSLSDFRAWVPCVNPSLKADTGIALSMQQMVFDPNMMKYALGYDYRDDWQTDPFKINMYHRVKKISNMSVYGEDYH